MRGKPALLVAVAVCAAIEATGCFPRRDNPFDPAEAPDAKLSIAVLAPPGAPCPPAAYPAPAPSVITESRGACIALDARQTTDPHGWGLSFQYAWIGTAGSIHVLAPGDGVIVSTSAAGIGIVDGEYMRAFPIGSPTTFRVRVLNDHGALGFAEATFIPLDSIPVPAVASSRTVPSRGKPWSPGVPIFVPYSGARSADADADPLLYCWAFDDDLAHSPFCTQADTVSHPVYAGTAGRVSGTLAVTDDSGATSDRRRMVVTIGGPNVFTAPLTGSGAISRLDSIRQPLRHPGLALVQHAGRMVWTSGSIAQLALWPADVDVGAPLSLSDASAVLDAQSDPANSSVWLETRLASTSDAIGVVRIDVAGDAIVEAGGGNFTATSETWRITPDGAGAWAFIPDGTRLGYVSVGGVQVEAPPLSLGSWKDLAVRPGLPEAWVLEGDPLGPTTLQIFGAPLISGAGPERTIPLPVRAIALAFVAPDELWLAVEGGGALLLDAARLDAGAGAFDAGVRRMQVAVAVGAGARMLADPVDGGVWLSGGASTLRIARDGSVTDLGVGAAAGSLDLDDGSIVATDGSGATHSLRPFPSAVVSSSLEVATTFLEPDLLAGGFWRAPAGGGLLEHRAEDGALLRAIQTLCPDAACAAPLAFPALGTGAVRISPDGQYLWVILDSSSPSPGVWRYDMDFDPPVADPVSPVISAADMSNVYGSAWVIPSTPPHPGLSEFAWVVVNSNGQIGVDEIEIDGERNRQYTFAATETPAAAALDLRANRLCLASLDGTQVRAHWVNTVFQSPNSVDLGAVTGDRAFASTTRDDGNGSLCVVAAVSGSTTTIDGWNIAGTLMRTALDATDAAISFDATSPDRAFLIGDALSPAPTTTVRIDLDTGARRVFPSAGRLRLVTRAGG